LTDNCGSRPHSNRHEAVKSKNAKEKQARSEMNRSREYETFRRHACSFFI
jgi:hypothetical protein